MPKVNFNFDFRRAERRIKRKLKKFLWFLGEKAFIVFLISIFLLLLIGGAIFYYYNFLVAAQEAEVTVKNIQLDENSYQKFLKNYAQRKDVFFKVDSKEYFNPFYQGKRLNN